MSTEPTETIEEFAAHLQRLDIRGRCELATSALREGMDLISEYMRDACTAFKAFQDVCGDDMTEDVAQYERRLAYMLTGRERLPEIATTPGLIKMISEIQEDDKIALLMKEAQFYSSDLAARLAAQDSVILPIKPLIDAQWYLVEALGRAVRARNIVMGDIGAEDAKRIQLRLRRTAREISGHFEEAGSILHDYMSLVEENPRDFPNIPLERKQLFVKSIDGLQERAGATGKTAIRLIDAIRTAGEAKCYERHIDDLNKGLFGFAKQMLETVQGALSIHNEHPHFGALARLGMRSRKLSEAMAIDIMTR